MEGLRVLANVYKKYSTPKYLYLAKYIKQSKKSKIKLLDVGCGNRSPSITKMLFPDVEYYGVDKQFYNLSTEDIEILENKFYKIDLENQSNLLDKALPDDFFDFIILHHVIEHIRNGLEVLDILSQKLNIGGGIYIEFPSVKSLGLPSMKGTLQFCDDPTHIRLYTIPEVANVLLARGFKIIKAGRRRNILRVLSFPLILPVYLLLDKPVAGAFWDILGFADFVYAIKISKGGRLCMKAG